MLILTIILISHNLPFLPKNYQFRILYKYIIFYRYRYMHKKSLNQLTKLKTLFRYFVICKYKNIAAALNYDYFFLFV